jgi:hypothetical protein
VSIRRIPLLMILAQACLLAHGAANPSKASVANPDSAQRITLPESPVAPPRYDFGAISQQGMENERRIGKLEEKVGTLESKIRFFEGAWWSLLALLALVGVLVKFIGKPVAIALVEHYAKTMTGLAAPPPPGPIPPTP